MKQPGSSAWWLAVPLALALLSMLDQGRKHAPHRAEWLEAADIRVRAIRDGDGPITLLLLHGFGESLTTWRAIFDPLAASYRVVAIDLPGFGGSTKPEAAYTLEAMTGRLVSLLEHETDGPVTIVGHSMGGLLAASLALARPDRVKALVLIAPAGYRVGLWGLVDSLSSSNATRIGRYLGLRSFITPIHDPAWLEEPDSAARYDLTGDPAYQRVATRVLEEFDFEALRDRFVRITQPTLLVWGGRDPVIPLAVGDTLRKLIPCNRFLLIPTAFHRPHAERPDTVLKEIRRFLAAPGC
ncbi:MAG: alpha/beta fold hydrolase [Gemmatimonadales bacterium]